MTETDLVVRNDFVAIRAIRPWLESTLSTLEPTRVESAIGGIELAVHEIATNSIDHADSQIDELRFSAELETDSVTVKVIDHGKCYIDQDRLPLLGAEPRVRGYGLLIVEQLATSLDHERVGHTNVWTATFPI